MVSHINVLDVSELDKVSVSLRNPVEYRKSGLSLNHIVGCPLDCSYCVRHLFGNFDQRKPQALMTDEVAFNLLISNKFFQANVTPIQIFNRATDPMLPEVKPHTHNILRLLNDAGFTNNVLIITRWKVSKSDCDKFNLLTNIKLTVLVTYSGIEDSALEPIQSSIAEKSLKVLYAHAKNYKVLLYWRPIIPEVNDSNDHIAKAHDLAHHAHATVFSGLFYREEIAAYYRANGLTEPYLDVARRKILPEQTEEKILSLFDVGNPITPIFRKTSCGVAYAQGQADYNGHYGIKELCDICPAEQVSRCREAWNTPELDKVKSLASNLGAIDEPELTERAILVRGLDEQRRYFIQHSLGFQVHDVDKPHHYRRHGRAENGWNE